MNMELNFFKILEIFLIDEVHIYFLVNEIAIEKFDSHFKWFVINNEEVVSCNLIYNLDEFIGPPINSILAPTGKLYIKNKDYF